MMEWVIGSFDEAFQKPVINIELTIEQDPVTGEFRAKPKYEKDREAFNQMVKLLKEQEEGP